MSRRPILVTMLFVAGCNLIAAISGDIRGQSSLWLLLALIQVIASTVFVAAMWSRP